MGLCQIFLNSWNCAASGNSSLKLFSRLSEHNSKWYLGNSYTTKVPFMGVLIYLIDPELYCLKKFSDCEKNVASTYFD